MDMSQSNPLYWAQDPLADFDEREKEKRYERIVEAELTKQCKKARQKIKIRARLKGKMKKNVHI